MRPALWMVLLSTPAFAGDLEQIPLPLANPLEFAHELDAQSAAELASATGLLLPAPPRQAPERPSWLRRLLHPRQQTGGSSAS